MGRDKALTPGTVGRARFVTKAAFAASGAFERPPPPRAAIRAALRLVHLHVYEEEASESGLPLGGSRVSFSASLSLLLLKMASGSLGFNLNLPLGSKS